MAKTVRRLSKSLILLTIVTVFIGTSLFLHIDRIYGYGSNTSPQIDMLSLLNNKISQSQQEDETILLSSPFEDRTIVLPENVYNPSALNIYIPVSAEDGDSAISDTITFAGCLSEISCPDENSVYSNAVLIPGEDFVNVAPYVNLLQNQLYIYIKGLINASFNGNTITYERITSSLETIQISILKLPSSIDNDINGLPENLNDIVNTGQIWFSNQLKNGSLRNVLLLPLNLTGDKVNIKVTENIKLELPTYQALLEQNLLESESSVPFAIISLSQNYPALIDIASGSTLSNWLENISNTAPGTLISGIPIISVFLLQKNETGDIIPISLENSTLSIRSLFSSYFDEEPNPIGAFTFPARILGQYFTNDQSRPNLWVKISHNCNENSIEVTFKGNCILSLFQLLLKINSVSPSRIPVNTPTPLTLYGVIPVTSPKTIEEADSLYEVKIAGIKANFRNGGTTEENIAITSYTNDADNRMYITSPSITTPGTVDIEVIDKSVEGYSYILHQALQVLDVYTVNAHITRLFPDISPNAKITLSPTHSPELSEPNKFFAGDYVVLTISDLDPDTYFVGWYDASGALVSTQTSVLIKVEKNISLTAKITKNQNYTIKVNIDPPDSGTVSLEPNMESYPVGSTVTLEAIPTQNYLFDKWLISDLITLTQNPLTIIVDQDYEITAVFKEKQVQLGAIQPFEYAEFATDDQGAKRLVVWVFGGLVCEISGINLTTDMKLQLINSTTGETLINELSPVTCSADGSTALLVVPNYPNYSDDMPAYVDTDLKYENSTIPAFRYYHYKIDANGITYTAFLANLTSPQKVSIHLESEQKNGELELPSIGDIANKNVAGIIRAMVLISNPSASASANFFGNTLIRGDIYGAPIAGIYEVSLHLYQPISNIETYIPGKPTYEIAKYSDGKPFSIKDKYPYKLEDGTANSEIVPIKFKLPANDLDYNYFRDGLSVFGQLVYFDYISNQVSPQKITSFQSQILANDVNPALTETSQGPAKSFTIRTYSLNSFGVRMGALLPFQTTSLIRLTAENGVLISTVEGKIKATIVSPQGGLAYIDRIVIKNPKTGYQLSVAIKDEQGKDEGKIDFKTPPSQEPGIMDILLYTRGNPTVPVATLPNTLVYTKEPVVLDYLWLIPSGIALIIFGAVAEGPNGGGPCFIATSAYGTPLAEEINVLRAIRDQYMLTNSVGTAFVEFYYNISPPIAEFISHHPHIAIIVRIILIPFIIIGRMLLVSPHLTRIIITILVTYLFIKKVIKYFHASSSKNL